MLRRLYLLAFLRAPHSADAHDRRPDLSAMDRTRRADRRRRGRPRARDRRRPYRRRLAGWRSRPTLRAARASRALAATSCCRGSSMPTRTLRWSCSAASQTTCRSIAGCASESGRRKRAGSGRSSLRTARGSPIAEMLTGGITCFSDMYYYPDVTGAVAAEAGMRAVLGMIALDFPTAWAKNADEYLRKGLEVHDRFKAEPLITTAFAPHAPYSVGDATLAHIRRLADELDVPVHMHVHETAAEVAEAVASDGSASARAARGAGPRDPGVDRRARDGAARRDEIELLATRRLERRALPALEPEARRAASAPWRNCAPPASTSRSEPTAPRATTGSTSGPRCRPAALLAKQVAGSAAAVPAAEALAHGHDQRRPRARASPARSARSQPAKPPTSFASTCRESSIARCSIPCRSWFTLPHGMT